MPGVPIAVIKDGQVAYQAGFGMRDKDEDEAKSLRHTVNNLPGWTRPPARECRTRAAPSAAARRR